MRVGGEHAGTLDKRVVGGSGIGVGGGTGIVEGRKDAWRTLLFDEVTDDLVVEVLDGSPLDLLVGVLLLFLLEGELDEDLLKLLVDVVDAELFERVVVKDLEIRRCRARR